MTLATPVLLLAHLCPQESVLPDGVDWFEEESPVLETRRAQTGHLLVRPWVNGEDVGWMILDTGAGGLVLDRSLVEELDFTDLGTVTAIGAGGTTSVQKLQGESLDLGPLSLIEPQWVAMDLTIVSEGLGVPVVGVLGYEVFSAAVIEVDLRNETVTMHHPADPVLADLPWQPVEFVGNQPCVMARFEGHEGLFTIDTGAAGGVLFHAPAVQRFDLLEGRDTYETSAQEFLGTVRGQFGHVESFEVGGRRFENLAAGFAVDATGAFAADGAVGNLGGQILEQFVLVFDYPRQRMAFLPRE